MKTTSIFLVFFGFLLRISAQTDTLCHRINPVSLDHQTWFKNPPIVPPTATPPPSDPPEDERVIYWIHGLGGVPENWHKVGLVTEYQSATNQVSGYPARKVKSLFPDLGPDKANWSLDAVGTTLHTFMLTDGEPVNQALGITGEEKLNNFAIGHSQGGLSPRVLDRRFFKTGEERLFNGLVTFGSPHQGARILNNVGMIQQFATEGCQAMSEGPLAEEISPLLQFVLKIFTSIDDIQQVADGVCSFVGNNILPLAFNDYTADVTNDYYVGSFYINQLNQFNSTMHQVAFWGDETEEPLVWHTVSSFDPLGNLDNPNNFTVFTADDETLPAAVDEALLYYQAKTAEWLTIDLLSTKDQCHGFLEWALHPVSCTLKEIFSKDARKIWKGYRKGAEWLGGQANNGYKVIIGALTFGNPVITGGECWCTQLLNDPLPSTNEYWAPASNSADCAALSNYSDIFCSWKNIISFLPLEQPSDGVVLQESAVGLPNATDIERMDKTNHMEMRNNEETKRVLSMLFEGEFSDQYFKTKKR